jgi:hypothetical protein
MKLKTTILLIAALFSISCSTTPVVVALELPPKITYPSISAGDVTCLPDSVFNKIKKRDKLKSARIETLINIIKTTH